MSHNLRYIQNIYHVGRWEFAMKITTVFRFAFVAIPNIFRVWGILWRKKRIADQASLHETVIFTTADRCLAGGYVRERPHRFLSRTRYAHAGICNWLRHSLKMRLSRIHLFSHDDPCMNALSSFLNIHFSRHEATRLASVITPNKCGIRESAYQS